MKKYITYFCIGFMIFLLSSIALVLILKPANNIEEVKETVYNVEQINEKIEEVLKKQEWREITENDKITLAFSSQTSTVSFIKNYLKDNKIAIFYVYGGPFDAKMQGNYIICTGFNDSGMAKIYYADDNYNREYEYSFEGVIEFAYKVLTFEM